MLSHTLRRGTLALATLVALPTAASAAEWGDISGRFVYGGDAPVAAKLTIDKDPCCQWKKALLKGENDTRTK